MLHIKPFSGLYYYNKLLKANNNVSRFVKKVYNFGDENLKLNLKLKATREFNVEALQNFKFYEQINNNFKDWLKNGILTVSGGTAFYVCEISYKISDKTYSVKGFFSLLKLPNVGECEILHLEDVDKDSTETVLNALKYLNFQTSSIFALFDDSKNVINQIINEMCKGGCFERAKHSNVSYKVWEVVDESLIEKLKNSFQKVDQIFLAGGREIFDAAIINNQKNGGLNYILTFFIDKSNAALASLPYHRIVSMEMFDFEQVLNKLSNYFDYIKCKSVNVMHNTMFNCKRENVHAFGVYAEESFGVLVLKDFSIIEEKFGVNLKNRLDSFIANEFIFQTLLNIEKHNLQFTSSVVVAKAAVDSGDGCLALFLNSERINDVFNVVKNGEKIPFKALEVFPRPVDGLVFSSIE